MTRPPCGLSAMRSPILRSDRSPMRRGSIREYTEAVRGRYFRATKKAKARMLDEFTQVTGYHRPGGRALAVLRQTTLRQTKDIAPASRASSPSSMLWS